MIPLFSALTFCIFGCIINMSKFRQGEIMKILVFSDSHGHLSRVMEFYNKTRCQAVIFLGDGLRDAQNLYSVSGSVPVYMVCGNCDFFAGGTPDMQLLELEGRRVLITHGHRQNVKSGLLELKSAALRSHADIALFGHTHQSVLTEQDGLLLANPGAASCGKYAVLTLSDKIEFEFGDIYD